MSTCRILSVPMQWTASPPYNYISLQYNPDASLSLLLNGGLLQAIIFSEPGGCAQFSIEIYQLPTTVLLWRTDYPSDNCNIVIGMLSTGAVWYIREDVSYNYITDIQFSVSNSPYPMSITLYPALPVVWVRSNVCWCGTNGGSTTFSAAYGTNTIGSDQNVQTIDPPLIIATSENSNMPYGSWSGAGSQSMSQAFGWLETSGAGAGGGGGGGGCDGKGGNGQCQI
jgi:hypothetical protein